MTDFVTSGNTPEEWQKVLTRLIRKGNITMAGYMKAKIYGLLHCASGKRMKMANRVFFKDETEAIGAGYRPCGHCLPEKYKRWKEGRSETI